MHVSEISHDYITDPAEKLKLNDKVMVKVVEVDLVRKRIALSIKQTEEAPARNSKNRSNSNQRFQKKEEDLSTLSVNDALAALKKKFGK